MYLLSIFKLCTLVLHFGSYGKGVDYPPLLVWKSDVMSVIICSMMRNTESRSSGVLVNDVLQG